MCLRLRSRGCHPLATMSRMKSRLIRTPFDNPLRKFLWSLTQSYGLSLLEGEGSFISVKNCSQYTAERVPDKWINIQNLRSVNWNLGMCTLGVTCVVDECKERKLTVGVFLSPILISFTKPKFGVRYGHGFKSIRFIWRDMLRRFRHVRVFFFWCSLDRYSLSLAMVLAFNYPHSNCMGNVGNSHQIHHRELSIAKWFYPDLQPLCREWHLSWNTNSHIAYSDFFTR